MQGIDLEVEPGEHIGVIGPNGVGKTTLFHSICGVLKPTGGAIQLYGRTVKAGQFHPEVGLVEERKINKNLFAEFKTVLQTYVDGECPVTYDEDGSKNYL